MDLVAFVMNIQPTALTLTTQCTDSVEGLRSIRKVSLDLRTFFLCPTYTRESSFSHPFFSCPFQDRMVYFFGSAICFL